MSYTIVLKLESLLSVTFANKFPLALIFADAVKLPCKLNFVVPFPAGSIMLNSSVVESTLPPDWRLNWIELGSVWLTINECPPTLPSGSPKVSVLRFSTRLVIILLLALIFDAVIFINGWSILDAKIYDAVWAVST